MFVWADALQSAARSSRDGSAVCTRAHSPFSYRAPSSTKYCPVTPVCTETPADAPAEKPATKSIRISPTTGNSPILASNGLENDAIVFDPDVENDAVAAAVTPALKVIVPRART